MTPFKTDNSLDSDGISHGFFSRKGGVSTGLYDSLNAGHGARNDPAAHIDENRARIARALGGTPDALLTCHQHHSADIIIATQPWEQDHRPKADGVVTKTPGLICSALAADCAPVLFADISNGVIGAAHAGWRGAVGGVTDAAIDAMESLGARRESIIAVVGPCISGPNYEVGDAFKAAALDLDPLAAPHFFTPAGGKAHFDLKAYVTARLMAAGIKSANALPDCTYAMPNDYFSYRYNTHNTPQGAKSDYGRNISAIMLANPNKS
ncbi:MAG: peptidoglycan editing factor PgeF [Robiginitomaculum sp.]